MHTATTTAAIDRLAQAAALCSQAEGRIEKSAPAPYMPEARAIRLLEAQWADARQVWPDPDLQAFKLACSTLRSIAQLFPEDHPRALLAATKGLLNGRARALEMRR